MANHPHPRVLHDSVIAEIADRRTRAQTEISKINGGELRWHMSIPVQETDSDMIFSVALEDSKRLEAEVYRLRGMIRQIFIDFYSRDSKELGDRIAEILWGTGELSPAEVVEEKGKS